MSKPKLISFKIEEEAKAYFDEYCEENHTTPSHELRLFIHNLIKDYVKKQKLKNLPSRRMQETVFTLQND